MTDTLSHEEIEAALNRVDDVFLEDDTLVDNLKMKHFLDLARDGLSAQWRDIKDAPKDGTVIDVWLGDCSESDRCFYCNPDTRRSPNWAWHNGKFRPAIASSIPLITVVQPTHFMLLPTQPEER